MITLSDEVSGETRDGALRFVGSRSSPHWTTAQPCNPGSCHPAIHGHLSASVELVAMRFVFS
jgi:hypothetical protein